MKVLITFNPVAGKGLGARVAASLRTRLEAHRLRDGRAIEAHVLETRLDPLKSWLTPHLEGADLLVILGGDGAVRMLAPAALDAQVPIYHYPQGTENLFSRDHGMAADPERLLDTIENGAVVETDVAEVDGTLMLLCASSGFDADVVHDLARHRTGPITHLSYLAPILRTLFRWRRLRSRVSVIIDDGPSIELGYGVLVIANSSQYALRLDPAPEASTRDGVLDVVFLPARSGLHLLLWAVRCRRGSHVRHPRLFHGRGARITLCCEPAARIQLDGDAFRPGQPSESVHARILARKLPVLVRTVREAT